MNIYSISTTRHHKYTVDADSFEFDASTNTAYFFGNPTQDTLGQKTDTIIAVINDVFFVTIKDKLIKED
jgi:hypothetical protein